VPPSVSDSRWETAARERSVAAMKYTGVSSDADSVGTHFTYSHRQVLYYPHVEADRAMNPNHRFLVVDDFAPMREIIRKVLQEIGYEHIQEANDGAMALPLLKDGQFDMLITDWNMPRLPGIELLRAVWRIDFDPGTNRVEVHMSRLRAKVDRGFAWPMLHTVKGRGYALCSRRGELA
jgi:hypothetical protein